jgi:hypothetical protein
MSRQPTWDEACHLQAGMFDAAGAIGGLDIQLVYYRGRDECGASSWIPDARRLQALMEKIVCHGGYTQIGKVLAHARRETQARKVQAMVFVGDAVEEKADDLCAVAGELGRLGTPAFMFQEGANREVERVFREIAQLTRGAYYRFDAGSAHQLRELLRAVAVYAAGGVEALNNLLARQPGDEAQKLLGRIRHA